MGGGGGITQQYEVPVRPFVADDAAEVEPRLRPLQMGRVGHEAVAAEILGEDLLAERDRLGLVHLVETELLPRLRVRLADEGRKVDIEAIGVGPDPPRISPLDGKVKEAKPLLGPNPKNVIRPETGTTTR